MMSGIGAVARKELREHKAEMLGTRGDLMRAVVPLGMFGILIPVVVGEVLVAPGALPAMGVMFAASLAGARAGDSVAGERDRGTLEMLLTTPLSDREIVLGKICALVVVGVLGAIVAAAAMIPVLVLRYPSGVAAIATPTTLTAILVPSILVATLAAALGVMVSARAPSGRAAQSRMGMGMMLVFFAPILILAALPESLVDALAATVTSWRPGVVITIVTVVLVLVDVVMIALALHRFRRSRMVVL